MRKSEKNNIIKIIILVIICIFLIVCCINSCSSTTKNDSVIKNKEIVQGAAILALKRYNYDLYTSSSLDDWKINNIPYEDSYRWTAVTYSNNTKIKWIYEWSGNDDDLILKYLLVGEKEVVNDLNS